MDILRDMDYSTIYEQCCKEKHLCHGDYNPSNVILTENGEYYVIDWAHATQGNASADSAKTFLLFSIQGKTEIAEKYLNLFH